MAQEKLLGREAKCRITGYTGIITSYTDWLFGCLRVGLQKQELDKDGKVEEAQWYDIEQVEIIGQGISKEEWVGASRAAPTGGPARESSRRAETG